VILFKRLTFANFLSSGNTPTTIELNNHKTTLIFGTNGSGKSTILDALCYCLFNKPFRSINLPQLVNQQNKKGLLTEVEFSIGKSEFLVRRGMKPKIFEVYRDGEALDKKAADKDNQQYLETQILKMNHKTFCQVVILGSSNFIPFMQLNSNGRKECIEDFLDIKVFSAMALLAKERAKGLKDKLNDIKNETSLLDYKIELQGSRIEDIENKSTADIEELKEEIKQDKTNQSKFRTEVEKLQKKDEIILEQVKELMTGSPKKMSNEFNTVIVKMDSKVERLQKELSFYQDHDQCPTCSQDISSGIKTSILEKNTTELEKVSSAKNQAVSKLQEFQDILDKIQQREEEAYKIQQQIYQYQTKIDSLQTNICSKETKIVNITTSTSKIDSERQTLQELNEQLSKLNQEKDDVTNRLSDHEIVVNLLKESGVKAQIVRKYLPVMNKFIRKYLQELDFPIFFTLDEEFNESVQSPFHQNFSYSSFSEGQKARIDLSLMLTWREIGKLKNSVSTNILILDEVFSSSLDDVGKENLFALLKYGLDDNQRIVVVDHTLSQNFKEKFDNSIEVTMTKGFSNYN